MTSRADLPPDLVRAAARAVAEAGGDMCDVEDLLDVHARLVWFSSPKADAIRGQVARAANREEHAHG